MTSCVVDAITCPTFKSQFKDFAKKHRKLKSDLDKAIKEIEADYTYACEAARPPKRKLDIEAWKYPIGSTDLKRSPRNGFRAIGVFLEEESQEVSSRKMYLVLFYFKDNQADFDNSEIVSAVSFLKGAIQKAQAAAGIPESNAETITDSSFA
jgi:hypothetical protein